MSSGWVALHRKILKWEWYDDLPTFKLFMHLLLMANHKERRWRSRVLERGQVLTSRAVLADETGLSQQQIRTCLERLKSTGEITIQSTNRFTVITVCKYETYQTREESSNQQNNQPEPQQPTSNQPTITQQGKNVRKREARPLPTLVEWLEYADEIGFGRGDAQRAFDHYDANGWKQKGGNSITQWKAACRTCKGRSGSFGGSGSPATRTATPPMAN